MLKEQADILQKQLALITSHKFFRIKMKSTTKKKLKSDFFFLFLFVESFVSET